MEAGAPPDIAARFATVELWQQDDFEVVAEHLRASGIDVVEWWTPPVDAYAAAATHTQNPPT